MAKKTTAKRTIFRLYAPEAKEVFLAGSFNDWEPAAQPLKPDKNGNWKTRISLESGTHEYRFVVDGEWKDDPMNEEAWPNAFGTNNSVVRI